MNIVDRVKKLISLSKSSYPEEAKSALLKAQELMVRHNINEKDVVTEETINNYKFNGKGVIVDRGNLWKYELSDIIAKNFRCKPVKYYQDRVYGIYFFGDRTDPEVASEIFLFIYKKIISLSKKASKELIGEAKKTFIDNYINGFIQGLEEDFSKQYHELMIVMDKRIEEDYNNLNIHEDNIERKMRPVDMGAMLLGYMEGNKIMRERELTNV